MDSYIQDLFQKAQKRSEELGISKLSKYSENNVNKFYKKKSDISVDKSCENNSEINIDKSCNTENNSEYNINKFHSKKFEITVKSYETDSKHNINKSYPKKSENNVNIFCERNYKADMYIPKAKHDIPAYVKKQENEVDSKGYSTVCLQIASMRSFYRFKLLDLEVFRSNIVNKSDTIFKFNERYKYINNAEISEKTNSNIYHLIVLVYKLTWKREKPQCLESSNNNHPESTVKIKTRNNKENEIYRIREKPEFQFTRFQEKQNESVKVSNFQQKENILRSPIKNDFKHVDNNVENKHEFGKINKITRLVSKFNLGMQASTTNENHLKEILDEKKTRKITKNVIGFDDNITSSRKSLIKTNSNLNLSDDSPKLMYSKTNDIILESETSELVLSKMSTRKTFEGSNSSGDENVSLNIGTNPKNLSPILKEVQVNDLNTSTGHNVGESVVKRNSIQNQAFQLQNGSHKLAYTVSCYRKQQSTLYSNSTPKSKMWEVNEKNEIDEEKDIWIQDKIKKLIEEVSKQQQIIAQISQALNLCATSSEFSDSSEAVEAERHLLIATHRRITCLSEIQRIRLDRDSRPTSMEHGLLTVEEITIPLAEEYVGKWSSESTSGYHIMCLLKYNDQVLATKTMPTLPDLLTIKFMDKLYVHNVYTDFKVILEIYGMVAKKEVLSHADKYNIRLNKKKIKKKADYKFSQSSTSSDVYRTPEFILFDYAIFSIREVKRNSWSLNKSSSMSPFSGVLNMRLNFKLSIKIKYKGFLTIFEDISGFGAWHRRWCYLNGNTINYWKYPDDEKIKNPLGVIDLSKHSSIIFKKAPREICARLNTMLLELCKETKISSKNNEINKSFLLSADTKEEFCEWYAYISKSISIVNTLI